eukprot:3396489-Pyramimonas_sp.AAC.1
MCMCIATCGDKGPVIDGLVHNRLVVLQMSDEAAKYSITNEPLRGQPPRQEEGLYKVIAQPNTCMSVCCES